MGSCFSKKGTSTSSRAKPAAHTVRGFPSRSSPPEPEAPPEETVKEVLSETPKPRSSVREERKEKEVEIEKRDAAVLALINGCDERSEDASEICSVSETFSVSTTVTEKRREDGDERDEVKKRQDRSPAKIQRKRSVSGDFSCKRGVGISTGGAGSGRSSPLPTRRTDNTVGRTFSGRETGQAARNRVHSGNGFRRDPGERSGRRSVSPATKRAADQRQYRSMSASRMNGRASPRRVPAGLPEDGERRGMEADVGGLSAGKESLENPLVSLECFIFL